MVWSWKQISVPQRNFTLLRLSSSISHTDNATLKMVTFQLDAKYDKSVELDARNWIEDVVEEPVEWGECDDPPGSSFADGLKSGEVLCKYVCIIKSDLSWKGVTCVTNETMNGLFRIKAVHNCLSSNPNETWVPDEAATVRRRSKRFFFTLSLQGSESEFNLRFQILLFILALRNLRGWGGGGGGGDGDTSTN